MCVESGRGLIRALCRLLSDKHLMPLYTLIMEYAGGTYISQVKAPSPKSACVKWAEGLDDSQVRGLGRRSKESLIVQMKDESPTPIDGVRNTWCASARIRGELVLINLVRTENGKKAAG